MGDSIRFNSNFKVIGQLPEFTELQVKKEPMFFSADAKYAWEYGGPLTRAFLQTIASVHPSWLDDPDFILDSRVHMLMPGWYPCIPGWHLDDVPRDREDGQPEHVNPSYRAEHILAVVGDCSLTSFLQGHIVLEDVPDGKLFPFGDCEDTSIYGKWHNDIEGLLRNPSYCEVVKREIQAGQVVQFDWQSFHMGNPATKHGWRWFCRASIRTHRTIWNETRAQVQAYLPAPMAGW
jgi:hypothetical protein